MLDKLHGDFTAALQLHDHSGACEHSESHHAASSSDSAAGLSHEHSSSSAAASGSALESPVSAQQIEIAIVDGAGAALETHMQIVVHFF